jgi:hypothetical protein
MKFDEFGFPLEQEDQSTSEVDEFGFPLDTAPQTGLDEFGFPLDLPAETAIPPVAAISEPSPKTDVPPVDPTGGFRSPTSGVTETNALLAQQIADQNRAAQIANAQSGESYDPAVTGQRAFAQQPVRLPGENPQEFMIRTGNRFEETPAEQLPNVLSQTAPTVVEAERNRLNDLFQQPGPLQAKVDANVNPSVSNVSGVPGNYQLNLPVGSTPINDEDAATILGSANKYEAPNNALSRGYGRMLGVTNILAQQLGIRDTDQFIDNMQELNRIMPEAPKDVQDGLRAITDENNTWGEVFRAMKDNPGAVLSVVGESLPQMIPSLVAATGATVVTGGNIFAGAAAVGATSGAIEFGNVLDEEIRSSGVDLNDDAAVQELFDNPEFWGRARERGARRGIAIGLFDALSMGMAGKLVNMAKVRGSGRLGVGGAATAELAGVQGPLGSVGEFGAQLLEQQGGFRDGLNLGEIALEGVAEIVPGAGEVAISTTAGGDPVALAAKQTMRDIDNAEFATTAQQEAVESLSPQPPPVQTELPQPAAPEADGPIQPPSANSQPVNLANPPDLPPQPAAPSSPSVKTEAPTAPAVQETAPPQPEAPVAEEAPTVNPQEAEPVGREVPSKPVTSVQTPDGQANFNVQGRVIELADLKQATGDLQPRDRSRKESAALAKERAGSMFNPARLLDDPTSGSGAPIIARDGTIMSGNGRVLTMQEVYANQSDSLASYRSALETAGINTEGFSQPVFVRQLADDMTVQELKRFADLSNSEAQAQMSMTERASRDSTRLKDSGIIDLFRGDFDIGSAQNREFVSEYAKKILSPTEQGAFVRPDGSPSAEGLTRIRNSILASAFDDADTLAIMLESTDDNIKAIGNAFMATAPKFAQLKKQVADGRTDAGFDITPKLSEMANLISRLRSEGVKPRDFYNQDSMFDAPDPEVRELVKAFYNDDLTKPNSMKAMKDFMDFYVNEALQKETGGLIPDDTTAQDIIDQGRRRTEDKKSGTRQNQQGLFEAASDVKSPNARGEQVQKRTNTQRRKKPQGNERGRIEADEIGTTSDVNEVSAMTPGTVFEQVSQTTRQSIYRDAFADSGLSADAIENKSTQQKFAILSRIVSKKFGIAAVTAPEEGAGYTQVNQLLDAYHNLQWMTHSLAMPNTFIGLDGQLKLEMPDKVTRFLGAFYPNANTIVMPQRSNSFAHEFGHALDYYLMDRYGNPDQMSRDTRGVSGLVRATQKSGSRPWLDGTPRNVEAAFGNMINALFLDNADLSLKIMSLEQQIAKSEAFEAKTGRKTKKLTQLREQLRKLSEGSGRSKVGSSEYSQTSATYGARERKVDYYLRPTEMFARAFEAYIAQKVEAAGGRNEFITKGDDAYKLAAEQVADADIRLAETFPKDHERHNIMLAMDQLIDALRNESIAQGTVAEAPGDTDMIDARGAFWTTQAYEERGSVLSAPKRVVQKIITDQKRASQIAANNAQAMKLRPNQFTGDTSFRRKINEYRDTYATNFIWTKRQILLTLSDRYNPTVDANGKKTGGNAKVRRIMEDIISKVATDPGTRQDRVTAAGGTFEEATRIEARRFYAIYDRIANEFNMDKLTDADQKTLRLLLTGDENTTLKASPEMVRLAAELRKKLLNPIYDYMVKNGQDVNYVQDVGYMPRMLDAPLAIQEVTQFLGELDGSKGAIPLYQQVIFDNEYGDFMEGDIDQMKALVSLALSDPNKTSVGAEIASNYSELSDIAKQMRETLKEIDNLNKAIEDDTGDADIDGLEATIEELSATLSDLHGELHLELRNPYAIAAGKDWHNRVAVREGSDPSTNGVQGSFAKKRKLPPEADRYMNDFYLNPTDAIMQYIPSAVRATEYSTRFGRDLVPEGSKMKEGRQIDYLEYQLDEAKLAGMKTHEAQEVKTIVDMVTGRYPGPDNLLARGLNNLNTLGTMALLPRAVLSGIAEPITAAVQTGSVVKGFQNFALALDGLGASLRGKSAVERKMYYSQLASVLGVIDLPQTGEVVANRLGGTSAEDSKNTARLALFFLRTGLVNMTIAQRKASMRVGMQFLIEQSAQYRNTKISETLREEARQTLQDFGVRPDQMDAFTDFAQNLDKTEGGLYEINQIMDVDGSLTDMGRVLATATNRFVDQTIQDPKIIDRPKWAERPIGRIVFGIQAFIAAFQRNVLEMSVKRFARDYKTKGAYKAIAPKALGGDGSLFGKMLLPLTALYIGHTVSSAAREFIFNRDKWDQEAEDEDRDIPIKYLLTLGISRSGFLGRADPLFNGFFSLKYQADLSNVLAGASGSYYLKAIQRIAGLGVENSPNTVSREYQALRGFYDIAVPMLGGRLATMPGVSNFFGYGLGMADMAITSPSAKHWVLRNTIKLSHGVEYRPWDARRKSGSGSSGGYTSKGGYSN